MEEKKYDELIPVPQHSKLINADTLEFDYIVITNNGVKIYTQRGIDNTPIVIPAEESE